MHFRSLALAVFLGALQFLVSPRCYAQTTDRYGGMLALKCSRGTQPHFYTQKLGERWWLCTPAGHGFFLKGVVGVNYSWTATWSTGALQTKYGSAYNPYVVSSAEDPADVWGFNYAIEQVNRLRTWGFNELADGAAGLIWPTSTDVRWNTSDHTIPDRFKLPFDIGNNTTRGAMVPTGGAGGCNKTYPLKDMINGVGSAFTAWHYNFGDYFDPHFPPCAGAMWNGVLAPIMQSSHADYLLYIYLDEGDQTGFLDAGPGFPTIDNNGVPDNPVSPSAHPAWVTLTTNPAQSSAMVLGNSVAYSDREVYSKVQLANDLANAYLCTGNGTPLACCTGSKTGTCSVDPASASYIGSGNMTAATNALNTAWGSNYTTLSTSDPNCTGSLASCLRTGSYSSWGKGSGLLDENGRCSSKGTKSCWIGDDITLKGETPKMQADLSAFLSHYLNQYFTTITGSIHHYAPGVLTQMTIGGFGVPPRKEVLAEAAKYLDLPQLTAPPICPTCTDIQQRIDFTAQYLGDKPWMMWEGFIANPDSAVSQYVQPANMATTQAGRGVVYQQMMNLLVDSKSTVYNDYPVVGFYWWAMYDSSQLNFGLCTPSDNAYNGKSATVSGIGRRHDKDRRGYRTGGEKKNYGDFISAVKVANEAAVGNLLTSGAGPGKAASRGGSRKWALN
jgi:hypothetical protein